MSEAFLYALIAPLAFAFIIMYSCAFFLVLYRRDKRKEKYNRKRQYTYEFCINQELKLSDKNFMFSGRERKSESNLSNFINVLFVYNKIAAGVNTDILDEEVVKSYFEGDFVQAYNLYRFEMIEFRNGSENPYLFNELEILLDRWQRKEYVSRRKSK